MPTINFKKYFIYHISGKSTKEGHRASMKEAWVNYNLAFLLLKGQIDITLYSFVLMNNHYHLLVKCESQNDLDLLLELLRLQEGSEVDIHIQRVCNFSSFLETYRYIYQNPLKAALCVKAENYSFSSLNTIVMGKGLNPYQDPLNIIYDAGRVLFWLNGKNPQIYYKVWSHIDN